MWRFVIGLGCVPLLFGCTGQDLETIVELPYYLVKGVVMLPVEIVAGDMGSGSSYSGSGSSYSSSSSGSSSGSSGLFESGKSIEETEGYKALQRIREQNREIERQNERIREENRRKQEAAERRRRQEREAAERRRQREWDEARAQQEREAAERQRQREREAADRRRQEQEAERQRQREQEEARAQQEREAAEQQRRREREAAERQRQREAAAAHAAHCLETRRLKGGFNVADMEIGNICNVAINVKGACLGTSFKANYPYEGTYSPYEDLGLKTLHPGKWRPAVIEEMCNQEGRTARSIACKVPFTPYFTTPNGSAYGCFD